MSGIQRKCAACKQYKDSVIDFTREKAVCDDCPPSKDKPRVYVFKGPDPPPVTAPPAVSSPVYTFPSSAPAASYPARVVPTPTSRSLPPRPSPVSYIKDDGTVVTTKPGNYLEAWDHRIKEPWTGRMKEVMPTGPAITTHVVTTLDRPTYQAAFPKNETQVFDAAPVGTYSNLSGVRVIRSPYSGPDKIERTTLEYPLLPAVTGERRILKADPIDIHPVGTRSHPAKVMPTRNGFQVSRAVVVHVDDIAFPSTATGSA